MLTHILLVYVSVLIPFMNSVELADLTPSPCDDEHCLYCDHKNLRYCHECNIAQTTTISGFKHCQTECYASQYGRNNNTSVEECMFCDRACEGCNGPLQVVEENMGCKRCKVGIYKGEMKKCLHPENSHTICSDNGHQNYYRDTSNSSEKLWTDSICRECHPTCSSCSSYTNDPIACVCKLFKKTDGSTSKCSNFCPTDYRKLQIENEPYQTCIKCPEGYELNVITGKCDKEVSIWSWKNVLYIIGIIILSIISAILMGLIIWSKNRYIKNKKMNHRIQYSEQIPLQSLRSFSDDESFPEYNGSMLYEELAKKIRCQARNPEDFLISELEIKIYHGLENRLGSGAFGNVYKGVFHGREEVAVKVIKDPGAQMEAYKGEGKIMALHLQGHPHLHTLKGICPGRLTYLVSELRLGNLKNFLRKNEHVFENEPWYLSLYCEQIASGMSFLEEHNILHRDLAARNVLVKNLAHVEVSDFGLSRVIRPNNFDKDYATQFAWRWLSIEALETCSLTIENDIWSYGVTCWEVFTFGKCVPYDDIFIGEDQQDSKPTTSLTPRQLLKALTRGVRLTKPNSCDKETFYGISECWLQVPLSRPRFDKLKEFFEEKVSSLHPNEGATTDIDYERPKPSTSKDTQVYAPKLGSLALEDDTQLPITYEFEDSYGTTMTTISKIAEKKLKESFPNMINQLKFPHDTRVYSFHFEHFYKSKYLIYNGLHVVYKYNDPKSNIKMAVKKITIQYGTNQENTNKVEEQLQKFLHEIKILGTISPTPNIVEFYGLCWAPEKSSILLCMEYMDFSLLDFYKILHQRRNEFPMDLVGYIIVAVVDALIFLKTNGILHRDIKPGNILVNKLGKIKLCDFGTSRFVENSLASTVVGTIVYWPPEHFTNINNPEEYLYNVKADIWSFGITINEIVYGKVPYVDSNGNEINNYPYLQNLIVNVDANEMVERCFGLANDDNQISDFVRLCLLEKNLRADLIGLQNTNVYQTFKNPNKARHSDIYVQSYVVSF